MDRRRFLLTSLAGALAAPLAAGAQAGSIAQEAGGTFRIGFVGVYDAGLAAPGLQRYQRRLRELGWVEGQNISTTYGWADGEISRLPGLVRSIMRTSPDLLVLPCGDAINAARKLRPDIPIVARCMDLWGFGPEIATAAHPGGFTTGVTDFSPGATRRRLEFLKELVPNLSRVGVLYHAKSSWAAHWSEVEAAARAAGVSIERIEWIPYSDPGNAFDIAGKRRVRALMTLNDGETYLVREFVFELAAHHRIPVLYDFPMYPAGDEVGLIAYYADVYAMFVTFAEQVDQILKGRKPGDIAVALPQRFRLVINLKAAKALGLTIPPSLLARADQVIE
jgi:putative ABC transport system substrate-binding protein